MPDPPTPPPLAQLLARRPGSSDVEATQQAAERSRIMLLPVDPKAESCAEPPELLTRLATLGVRLLDPQRVLVLDVPYRVLASPDWAELAPRLAAHARRLHLLAAGIGTAQAEIPPEELVERLLALPARCLGAFCEQVGDAVPTCDEELGELAPAALDLLYAAFLRALARATIERPTTGEREPTLGELLAGQRT